MKIYNKLVRDNIPNIIKKKGEPCTTEILSDKEFQIELEKKLQEECKEYLLNKEPQELADILEVTYAIAKTKGISEKELNKIRKDKATRNGKFDKKILLISAN